MLVRSEQATSSFSRVVKIDTLVPRCYKEPEGSGRELEGGDGIGGWGCELDLSCGTFSWVAVMYRVLRTVAHADFLLSNVEMALNSKSIVW